MLPWKKQKVPWFFNELLFCKVNDAINFPLAILIILEGSRVEMFPESANLTCRTILQKKRFFTTEAMLTLSVQIFIGRLPTENRKALWWLWDHRKVNIFPNNIDFNRPRPGDLNETSRADPHAGCCGSWGEKNPRLPDYMVLDHFNRLHKSIADGWTYQFKVYLF